MRPLYKLLIGIGAIVPLLGSVLLGAYIAIQLVAVDLAAGEPSGDPLSAIDRGAFDTTDLIVFGAVISFIVLFELIFGVILAVHAGKDPRLAPGAKVGWILALLFLSPFAFPTYFVLYVLREPTPRRVPDLDRAPIAS